ncbi:MAG: hypothetical protein OSA43_11690 [Pirellulales bacterium]|nr:hypothetical protein [Pirellulales bacterium]
MINRFQKVTRFLRELDPHLSIHQLEAFLIVSANRDGISMRDVESQMDVSNATLSRIMSNWSAWKRPDVPGMDMIKIEIDQRDRRYRIATLTPKGIAVAEKLETMMGDE